MERPRSATGMELENEKERVDRPLNRMEAVSSERDAGGREKEGRGERCGKGGREKALKGESWLAVKESGRKRA
jgi:hypothetical protein